jgi:DNA-binding transcriptional LysR family regulator
VSQNIQSLERTLGVSLFHRAGRRVRLTEAGQALLPMARELLARARHLEDAMATIQGEVTGDLYIGCSSGAGNYLLPLLAAAFGRQHPAVRIHVNVLPPQAIIERLLEGRLPIGVVSTRVEHEDLEYRPFFEDQVVLIAPADHPWAQSGSATPADLLDQPLILREETAGTTQAVLDALSRHGISRDMLKVNLELGSDEAIEIAIEEGLAVGFVSKLAAARCLRAGRVRQVTIPGLNLRRLIYMARNRRGPFSRAETRFWTFALEEQPDFAENIWQRLAGEPPAKP